MLRRCIKFELKRAFTGIGMKLSFAMGIAIVLLDFLTFYQQYFTEGVLIKAWIGTDFQFAYNSLFYVLLPIFACLPHAGSYYQDIITGYDKNICIKISRQQYLVAKGCAVYISSFLCVVVPLAISLFLAAGIYPNRVPEMLDFTYPSIIDCYRFPHIYSRYPLLYCILFIIIDGMFAGTCGLFSIMFTKWCKSRFSAIVLPFIVYILTSVIMAGNDAFSMSVMEMLNPTQRYISTVEQMCYLYAGLNVLCVIVIWIWGRKRDIL